MLYYKLDAEELFSDNLRKRSLPGIILERTRKCVFSSSQKNQDLRASNEKHKFEIASLWLAMTEIRHECVSPIKIKTPKLPFALLPLADQKKMVYDKIDIEELAPWRSPLARALHRNRSLPHSRYLQLATVAESGFPANRTVVFRGFLEVNNNLKIITDIRSEKIEQIAKNPRAEACWYFSKTREQFRLAGEIKTIKAEDLEPKLRQIRASTWQEISDAARIQFAWPPPGQKKAEATAFELASPDKTEPLPNFCLLLLEATKVEHLELRGDPQNRWLYQRQANGLWSKQEINP